jgi:geranylgeranyl pyrophosphate synthase
MIFIEAFEGFACMLNERVKIVYDKEGYSAYLEEANKLVDQEISSLMPQIADLGLYEKVRYVLQIRGKRLRPTLVMLSAQSLGERIEPVKKLALAIEVLHTATLIHDDILDKDLFRRNMPTVNAKWGVRDAVLVGDVLASLSLNLSADYGENVVKIMSRTCMLLSDGEYIDVENAKKRLRESDYLETIERKSASLFKAATQCGAIAANARGEEIDALAEFGENFGLAYQIKDDLLDVTALENSIPQDINEFRATLPIIHFCEVVEPNVRRAFFEAVGTVKSQSSAEKAKFLDRLNWDLERTGSLRYCADRINHYIDSAINSLVHLRKSRYKTYLIQMADSLRPR